MKWFARLTLLASALAAVGIQPVYGQVEPSAPPPAYAGPLTGEFVEGELVVGFTAQASAHEVGMALSRSDVTSAAPVGGSSAQVVRLGAGQTMRAAIETLRTQPGVRFVEPNYIWRTNATPNDASFGQLSGLNNTGQTVNGTTGTADADIDAPEAWNISTGSTSVVVAVVDTGIDYDHPDFAGNLWANPGETGGGKETNGVDDDNNGFIDDWRGWDFVANDNDPKDYDVEVSHGTHTAGTIGARGNNSQGVTGVNWQVSLVSLRVFNAEGSATSANIAAAFNYAGNNGIKVVNYSGGGATSSVAVQSAIDTHPNTLYVVSAGNNNLNLDTAGNDAYPCEYPSANIICVAASDQNDGRATFSNYGSNVDIAAPGVNVLSLAAATSAVFSDTFSTDPFAARWTKGAGIGTNLWATEAAFSPTGGPPSLTDGTPYQGNYPTNSDTWVQTTNAINLAGRRGCSVFVPLAVDVYSPDNDAFEIYLHSTAAIGLGNLRRAWQGTGSLIDVIDANGFDGGNLYMRLGLYSDTSVNPAGFDGVYVDNVEVRCTSATYTGNEYRFLNGTSMAAPQVTGAAALLLSVNGSLTTTQLKNAILSTGDTKAAFTSPVTNTGKRLNLYQAALSLDLTPPTITLTTPPAGAIYTQGQVVNANYTCADTGGSGLATCTGNVANGTPIDTATTGAKTFTVNAADNAGNTTSITRTYTVNPAPPPADLTPPTITLTTPSTGAVYTQGQVVNANYTCADTGGSGLATCTGNVANGTPIDTATTGAKTFTVFATDAYGNESSLTTHYTVVPAPDDYPTEGGFTSLNPVRILDTRQSIALAAGQTITVDIAGRNSVPAGATAVLVNLTATNAAANGYLTTWPTGEPRPVASSLNFAAGQTVANLAVSKLGTDGSLSIWNSADAPSMQPVDLIIDVLGYFIGESSIGALNPTRLLDTRAGGKVPAGGTVDVPVLNRGGVPATGVGAVILNVTATDSTTGGYLTTWPAGETRPVASSLNFAGGQTVANLVIAKVGANGSVSIWNSNDSAAMQAVNVIVDVVGWLPSDAGYGSLTPTRLLDTRQTTALAAGQSLDLRVLGSGGVPSSGVTAVVVNLTAAGATTPGYLTLWPTGQTRPVASAVNFAPGATVANLVVAKVGADGSISIWNSNDSTAMGPVNVVIDVVGYFTG